MKVLLLSLAFLCGLMLPGCSRSGPKPLTVEEIPPAIRKAFQPARLLTKQNAEGIAKLIEDKQYAVASIQLQTLLPLELSNEQRDVTSAALETVNRILSEQAASAAPEAAGDARPGAAPAKAPEADAKAAAEVMENYIRTK